MAVPLSMLTHTKT